MTVHEHPQHFPTVRRSVLKKSMSDRPVCDRAPGSIPPGEAAPRPAPRSPLRGLRPSGHDPCRLRSLRSLRAPLARDKEGTGNNALECASVLRTLRPKKALGCARTWAEACLACICSFSPACALVLRRRGAFGLLLSVKG